SFARPPPTAPSPPSLHDALPISAHVEHARHVLALEARRGLRLTQESRSAGPIAPAVAQKLDRHGRAELEVTRREDDAHASLAEEDRKSTRLNSSHVKISYAVFCL